MARTRDRERTRRTLLDTAARLLREQGVKISLETIAVEAGVSKSGLLHHFPSRNALIRSVAEDAMQSFRARAMANIDLSENHPGKLLRAYIRTIFSQDEEQKQFDYLWDVLAAIGGLEDLLVADTRTWQEGFGADGLHPDRILVVQNAAEGYIANAQWDTEITSEMHDHMRDLLLAITNENGPMAGGIS